MWNGMPRKKKKQRSLKNQLLPPFYRIWTSLFPPSNIFISGRSIALFISHAPAGRKSDCATPVRQYKTVFQTSNIVRETAWRTCYYKPIIGTILCNHSPAALIACLYKLYLNNKAIRLCLGCTQNLVIMILQVWQQERASWPVLACVMRVALHPMHPIITDIHKGGKIYKIPELLAHTKKNGISGV